MGRLARLGRKGAPILPLLIVCASVAVLGQTAPKIGEWRSYGGDLASTRYSPLDQINGSNFKTLEVAWRFNTGMLGPRPEYQFEGTPLMVNGVVYSTAGTRRAVVANARALAVLRRRVSFRDAVSRTGPTAAMRACCT